MLPPEIDGHNEAIGSGGLLTNQCKLAVWRNQPGTAPRVRDPAYDTPA